MFSSHSIKCLVKNPKTNFFVLMIKLSLKNSSELPSNRIKKSVIFFISYAYASHTISELTFLVGLCKDLQLNNGGVFLIEFKTDQSRFIIGSPGPTKSLLSVTRLYNFPHNQSISQIPHNFNCFAAPCQNSWRRAFLSLFIITPNFGLWKSDRAFLLRSWMKTWR